MTYLLVARNIKESDPSMESEDDADVPPNPSRLRNLLLNLRRSKTTW